MITPETCRQVADKQADVLRAELVKLQLPLSDKQSEIVNTFLFLTSVGTAHTCSVAAREMFHALNTDLKSPDKQISP